MSINLVTYANQTVTPTNDAIIYERAIDQNGIFYGCNVTVTSNTVNITGGYGIICGREFVINSDSLTVTLAPSGTLQGRLYVRLDLADADAPIQLLTATGNTLPPLEHDSDVNYTNGTYEMELATFTVGVSALSDVVETYEEIVGTRDTVERLVEWAQSRDYVGLDWSQQVDITTYNSSSNLYTVPTDGVIRIECNYRQNSYTQLLDADGHSYAQASAPGSTGLVGAVVITTPVYKGQKFYIGRSNNGYGGGYFIPYILG